MFCVWVDEYDEGRVKVRSIVNDYDIKLIYKIIILWCFWFEDIIVNVLILIYSNFVVCFYWFF